MQEEVKSKKKNKKKIAKVLAIVISLFLALFIIADAGLSLYIYNDSFGKRFTSFEPLTYRMEDFEGLSRTRYEFESDKGQKLVGYLYEAASDDKKGIIVFAHGFGGGGHNSYMSVINYIAQHGYYVFAYDATACDESEGKEVGGLEQGAIDLDSAITFVENSDEIPDLPIGLMGHSWGGYSVCTVLKYHPEVKAVVECAGFNESSDMIEGVGKTMAGNGIYLMLPFIKLNEKIKFGDRATDSALEGFAATDAKIMVVQSKDDDMVSVEYGYDKFYEKYKDDDRFTFVLYEDRGHNYLFMDKTYMDKFNEGYDQWLKTLDYDYNADENEDRFEQDDAQYYEENFDRQEWSNVVDEEIVDQFIEFYDKNL